MNIPISRRHFVRAATGVGAGLVPACAGRPALGRPARPAGGPPGSPLRVNAAPGLAVLGGKPVRTEPFPAWPVIRGNDESNWQEVLETRRWCRLNGHFADRFEEKWAARVGARYCLATASGTTALLTSLNALGIGPGDEVLVPPYTFVATINVVLLQHALPIFVDTDRETFQMDARKIEARVTPRTRLILPVHLGGNPADMDKILEVAKEHALPVLEDACQAHLAEWRHEKVSTLGTLGCFSFQASKNLNSGEGGAVLTNNPEHAEFCRSFHNQGRGAPGGGFGYVRNGSNFRMTEFQAALLLAQLDRLEDQSRTREQNAQYLTGMLREIPGITPERLYEGCTRNAYHIYMLRYDPSQFAGLPRARFLKALRAEGIPCSGGYTPLNKEPFLKKTVASRAFRAIYSEQDLARYEERNQCPENDKLCEEAVWFSQTMLIGPRQDMDQIAEAIRKIHNRAGELVHG